MTELGNVLSPETQSPPLSTTVDEQKGCGKLVTNRVKRMVAHQLGRVDPRGAWRERYAFNFFWSYLTTSIDKRGWSRTFLVASG